MFYTPLRRLLSVRRRPGSRRLRLDPMECRVTPALAVAIVDAPTSPVPEGSVVTLNASATDTTTPTSGTFGWTVFKDGATAPFATWTGATFNFLPTDDGSYEVRLTVTDTVAVGAPTATATATIDVDNVAPTVTITGPGVVVPGLPATFTLVATDPSSVDTAAGFTFEIDWDNDKIVDETLRAVPSGTTVTHTFEDTGSATVSVTATDKDGGTSPTATQTVSVETAALIDDPLNPGQQLLAVGGTAGDDNIRLVPAGNSGRVRVFVNGELEGTFGPAGRIAIYGLDGDDNIHLAGSIRVSAWLDGGDGDDRLHSAKGNDVLRGGAGDDHLNGGQGADVVIGGAGADRILGGPGDDLMIAGTTGYDADEADLFELSRLWANGGTTAARVAAVRAGTVPLSLGGGTPTVFDDGAVDLLTGAAGGAWVFADPLTDVITGAKKGLFVNDAPSTPGNGNGNGGGGGGGNGNRPTGRGKSGK